MVAGRAGHRPATRPQGEERLAECPPNAGRRDTRAAASAARTGAVLARLYDRAGRADDAQGLPCAIRSDRGSGQDAIPDPSAHATAWLRLRPSQRWPRHQGVAGVRQRLEISARLWFNRSSTILAVPSRPPGEHSRALPRIREPTRSGGDWPDARTTHLRADRRPPQHLVRGRARHRQAQPSAALARQEWEDLGRY